jgi:hypothetical protein
LTAVDLSERLQKEKALAPYCGHMLAFVNEFDLVTRADQTYVRSLIDLYLTSYKRPSLMGGPVPIRSESLPGKSDVEEVPFTLPPLTFQLDDEPERMTGDNKSSAWKLPQSDYHILGEIILLRKERETKTDQRKGRELRAYTMSLREYESLVFCGVQTHSRSFYGDRIELLRKGTFNHKNSWRVETSHPDDKVG